MFLIIETWRDGNSKNILLFQCLTIYLTESQKCELLSIRTNIYKKTKNTGKFWLVENELNETLKYFDKFEYNSKNKLFGNCILSWNFWKFQWISDVVIYPTSLKSSLIATFITIDFSNVGISFYDKLKTINFYTSLFGLSFNSIINKKRS